MDYLSETKIIDTRYGSNISGGYSESLCIQKIDDKNFRLFIGGYEGIGEVSEFYNEEEVEEVIPEIIDGQLVQEVYDGIIYGGSIIQNEDNGEVIFSDTEDKDLNDFLKGVSWDHKKTLSLIKKIVTIKKVYKKNL